MEMENYSKRLHDALVKQHKFYFNYDNREMKADVAQFTDCPVCGSTAVEQTFAKDWFKFSKCKKCEMVFLNPRLNDEATYRFYDSEWNDIYNEAKFYSSTESSALDDEINSANLKLIEKYNEDKGQLLEIGCGKGYFLRLAEKSGFAVTAVELNKENVENTRKLLTSGKVYNGDLYAANFESNAFDVIYMRDVLEHIPNPIQLLKECFRIGKNNSLLYIEVPNIEGLIYKIVKENHTCVFAFEHPNYWSYSSLKKALELSGYEILDVQYQSLDFTIKTFLSYGIESSYTRVFRYQTTGLIKFVLRATRRIFMYPPFLWIDHLLPKFANIVKRGSVIKVLARRIG